MEENSVIKQRESIRAVHRPVDFDNPPVVETAIGLVFAPLKSWSLLHFGLLWERIRLEYPQAEVRLPTGSVQFEGIDLTLGPDLELSKLPLRCSFTDSVKTQSLQIQNNSFVRNWRKTEPQPARYVHYDEIRPLFVSDWKIYQDFLNDEKLQLPEVWQAEVTYINHLVRGQEWESPEELSNIFPFWSRKLSERHDFHALAFGFTASLPQNSGQLQVSANPVIRSDGKQVIQLAITVSHRPLGSGHEQLMSAIDACHEYVVTFFADFTSQEMQALWKRTK